MLFVELLFWSPARLSEDIRDEYNWQARTPCFVSSKPTAPC